MLHYAIFGATCVATKLRDKLQEKLPSVTAPLSSLLFCDVELSRDMMGSETRPGWIKNYQQLAEHNYCFFSKYDGNQEIQFVFDRYDIPLSLKPEQEGKYLVTPFIIALPMRRISSKYR